MEEYLWAVVPICNRQLKDVNPEDLIDGGLYRKCNTYKGGGGYDKFNSIYERRFGHKPNSTQFVVQLYGCTLKCWYCYVTEKGIFGEPTLVSSDKLIGDFTKTELDVFHLMGGSPALYLEHWKEIAGKVKIFHSDLILVEKPYEIEWLIDLPGLFAISLKDFPTDYGLLWRNLDIVVESGISFYITFTGKPVLKDHVLRRYGEDILQDSFRIPIIYYSAIE